jgi:DNA-binding SARP family transcriptional activator
MMTLHIQLLGDFQLRYGDQVVTTINQPRLQSLLAYLLLHRHAPQARHHLAFTFWPDIQEAQARNNLRQMLHQLRHALPTATPFLQTDANTVQWVADGPFRLDVADFEAAVRHAANLDRNTEGAAAAHALQTALAVYQGDLLPSCYDDWIMAERGRLRQQAQQLCRQLSQRLEAERAYTAALAVAQRLQQLDPLDETTYVRLMRLHALNQDRAGALRVYHECVTFLQRELGVEPGDELQASYKQLRQLAHQPTTSASQPAPHASLLPLIGRQPEWERLWACWQAAARGQPALALITGEAGIGKSRLAEERWAWAARQGITCARTRAYAAEGRLAYAPLIEWLRTPPLMATLARVDPVWRCELARLLPELLTQQPALPPPGPLTEYWQRQRFFEALARAILAGQTPLLLLIDDLQWCDQETLEWLHFLLRFDAKARLLVVGTPTWRSGLPAASV